MRQTPWILALGIFVLAFTPLSAGAADRNLAGCTDDTASDDTVIASCTAVILSGQQPDAMLVTAYKNLSSGP